MDKSWKDHKYAAEPEITVNSCPEVSDQTQKMLEYGQMLLQCMHNLMLP